MGDKIEAKRQAKRLGFPSFRAPKEALRRIRKSGPHRKGKIGFPILIKAAAGGGGRA